MPSAAFMTIAPMPPTLMPEGISYSSDSGNSAGAYSPKPPVPLRPRSLSLVMINLAYGRLRSPEDEPMPRYGGAGGILVGPAAGASVGSVNGHRPEIKDRHLYWRGKAYV